MRPHLQLLFIPTLAVLLVACATSNNPLADMREITPTTIMDTLQTVVRENLPTVRNRLYGVNIWSR